MTTQTRHKSPRRVRPHPPVTVTRAARVLKVSREHLSRVIHGHLPNARLLALYQEYIAQNTTTPNPIPHETNHQTH